MRISSNFTTLGIFGHSNPYNSNNNHVKTDVGTSYTDTISFGHRGPKAYKKLQSAANKKVVEPAKRHIKNCLHGEFNRETQLEVENIHRNLDELRDYIEKNFKTKQARLTQIRQACEFTISGNKQLHGTKFKMGDGNTLTVLRHTRKPNLLRLTVEENGQKTHFMLDSYDKVIANIWQKEPSQLPRNLRYMTVDEIEKSGVKTYVNFANQAVEMYKKYIMGAPTNRAETFAAKKAARAASEIPSKTTTVAPKPATTIAKTVEKVVNTSKSPKDNILALFNTENPTELPKHLKPIISERSGLLGFSTKLDNGSELKVTKVISATYGKDLRYLSILEREPSGIKKYTSIDLETGDVLKTSIDGKPVVLNDILRSYTPAELKESPIHARLAEYAEQIFKTVDDVEAAPAEVIRTKAISKAMPKELNVEDFEDRNVTKLLEEEFAKKPPVAETPADELPNPLTEQVPEVVKVHKKRGRKPKVKTEETPTKVQKEEPTPKTQTVVDDIVAKLQKIKEDATKQATDDAKVFADTYFDTFIEQVQNNLKSKMANFTTKMGEFINSLGKTNN